MSDDPVCAKCGHPRSNHPYRHPFVGPSRDETIAQQAALAAERDALQAKLAKAVDALERIEDASKYFGNCPEATETTVRYAHETTRRLARTTLAELKGENDE